MKKWVSLVLALITVLSFAVPAVALMWTDADELALSVLEAPGNNTKINTDWVIMENSSDRVVDSSGVCNTVKSGSTIYWLSSQSGDLGTEDISVKVSAVDGAQYISSAEFVKKDVVDKILMEGGNVFGGVEGFGNELWVLQIRFKDFSNNGKKKVSFKISVATNRDIYGLSTIENSEHVIIPAKTKCTVYTKPIYVVGVGTAPLPTEDRAKMESEKINDHTIVWASNGQNLAQLKIVEEDLASFFVKINTKWGNEKYAAEFADQGAYLYDYQTNQKPDAAHNAILRLRIPFVDKKGNLAIPQKEVAVYQVVGGEAVDITDSGKIYKSDGWWVFETKIRKLGTYIVARNPTPKIPEKLILPSYTE